MRLYYHKTDGGAEYLCSSPIPGTEEGSFGSDYIVRIDGDITKDAEMNVRTENDDVRLFWVVDSKEDEPELFETQAEAKDYLLKIPAERKPRLYIAAVRHAYMDDGARWTYDDLADTFTKIK